MGTVANLNGGVQYFSLYAMGILVDSSLCASVCQVSPQKPFARRAFKLILYAQGSQTSSIRFDSDVTENMHSSLT